MKALCRGSGEHGEYIAIGETGEVELAVLLRHVVVAEEAGIGAEEERAAEGVEFIDDGTDSCDVRVFREELKRWHHGHVVSDKLSDESVVDAVHHLRRVSQNIDAALHGDADAFEVGGMGEYELAVAVRSFNGSSSDVELHGGDMAGSQVGAGKELDDIGAKSGVAIDEGSRFYGGGGLSQLRAELGRKIVEIERDCVGRKERESCGVDARAEDFATLDALAQGKGVAGVGAGVDNSDKSGVGEHLLELAGKLFGGLMGCVSPLWFHKVNMVVPETGEDDAAIAGQGGNARWDR